MQHECNAVKRYRGPKTIAESRIQQQEKKKKEDMVRRENAIKARSRVMISSKMKNEFLFRFWHDARMTQQSALLQFTYLQDPA